MKPTLRSWWVVLALLLAPLVATAQGTEEATFAGGCFWSMELAFHSVPGVVDVTSGYTGGTVANPSYEQVSEGNTGHVEAVRVRFDPSKITYAELLNTFWHHVDPTDDHGQFCDDGPEYRSEIFFHGETQQRTAEASLAALRASGRIAQPIVTKIVAAGPFYPAEGYHQDYARKNPLRYGMYRAGCGRDRRLEALWGKKPASILPASATSTQNPKGTPAMKNQTTASTSAPASPTGSKSWRDPDYRPPDKSELKARLTPEQYDITQEDGTEPPFHNAFWNNHAAGIYVDVVSGEPLFSSVDKFESGTGWPSFTRPLESANVKEHQDRTLFMTRTEVRSAKANSHLGHVFDDGPGPTGLRYCIDSAALRFIPADKLAAEGYPEYARLFEQQSAQAH